MSFTQRVSLRGESCGKRDAGGSSGGVITAVNSTIRYHNEEIYPTKANEQIESDASSKHPNCLQAQRYTSTESSTL